MTEVEQALRALREVYRAALPARVAAIVRAVDALLIDDAAAFAHRLAGSAGTYGFTRVGDAAGSLEDALRAPRVDAPTVRCALAALREAVAGLDLLPLVAAQARPGASPPVTIAERHSRR